MIVQIEGDNNAVFHRIKVRQVISFWKITEAIDIESLLLALITLFAVYISLQRWAKDMDHADIESETSHGGFSPQTPGGQGAAPPGKTQLRISQ